MISRKTAMTIGTVYEFRFMHYTTINTRTGEKGYRVRRDALYDFLYENNYDAWLCNQAKSVQSVGSGKRAVQEWVMKLHTGETLYPATPNWTWEQREKLGQQHLQDFAQDILNDWDSYDPPTYPDKKPQYRQLRRDLLSRLELDGYEYKDGRLLAPEYDVLDADEATGVLQSLYSQQSLPHKEKNFEFLKLSEDHYVAGRWADSIHNSRKFLEGTLQEVAAAHSSRVKGEELAERTYDRAVRVREYLERENLLDTKETETLAKVYGLLSETGSHPNMAYNDQARLLRHLALTFSQFAMLRLQGSLKHR